MKRPQQFIVMLSVVLMLNLMGTGFMIAWGETAQMELTYEAATLKALNASTDLTNNYRELDKLEKQRSTAAEEMFYGGPDETYLPQVQRIKSLDASLEIAKRDIEVTEEKIAFQVQQAMNDLLSLKRQQEIEVLEMESAAYDLSAARRRQTAGILSVYDLQVQEANFIQLEKETLSLENSLLIAFERLNALLGIRNSNEYDIVETTTYDPVGTLDEQRVINRVMTDHPSILNLEKQIEMAELGLVLYRYNAGGDSYEIKEIDLSMAKSNLVALKRNLQETARTSLYQLQQMETNYEMLEDRLTNAWRDYHQAEAYYDAGIGIISQVNTAALTIEQLQFELLQLSLNHWQQKELLYRPYL